MTTDGRRFSSEQLAVDGKPVFLIFGSLTCPVTESGAEGLRELHRRYGDKIRFVMVNVREAHPGEAINQPKTAEQKAQHARALQAHHHFRFEVAVDDLDGTVHRAFGPRPNSAYIIDPTGTIQFRAQWANVTDALEPALAAAAARTRPRRAAASHTIRALAKMTGHADVAFRNAGRGALRDTWKAAPPLGVMTLMAKPFVFLHRDRRGLPVMVLMTIAALASVLAATSHRSPPAGRPRPTSRG